ncbi:MAG: UDP-2,4-diacetamido-2,4,6-trideoxy-beta-L-altropyranose hydrolase [Proteobacteria bacterium]|nr:UDP-2,4-diacetamido-2,4,6-trideoxy-beta-L-altropyranose hydrolase [Pseudomonadota bacterium]
MKVAIRVDASSQIGSGHFMRCLTLADALRQRGAQSRFVSRHLPTHLREMLVARSHEFMLLDGSTNGGIPGDLAHSGWLGTSQRADAEFSIQALFDQTWNWLVVDHYALDARWESALRHIAGHILVIDDIADRRHDCDVLLDQNLVEDMEKRYRDILPTDCNVLLGPDYALLQPIYADLHDRLPPREGAIKRILICFGGADQQNLTGRALAAFMSLNRQDIQVDVVVSANSPQADAVRRQVTGHSNIHLYGNLPTLAAMMAKADLAIGAGGATNWERLCVGLPALVVTIAENQRAIAAGLHERGLVRWLGHQDQVDEEHMAQALGKLIETGLDASWSKNCTKMVDGKGINRVCIALTTATDIPIRLRCVEFSDEALLLKWANDPSTRMNAFSSSSISAETHQRWFRKRLRNPDECVIYIAETNESLPMGQVRFEKQNSAWEIDYSVVPAFRGRGLGYRLLEAAISLLRRDHPGAMVLGKVKSSNFASRRIFEALGFDVENPDAKVVLYKYVL